MSDIVFTLWALTLFCAAVIASGCTTHHYATDVDNGSHRWKSEVINSRSTGW